MLILFLSGVIIGIIGMGGGILILPLLNNVFHYDFNHAVFLTLLFSLLLSLIGIIKEKLHINYFLGFKYVLYSTLGAFLGSLLAHEIPIFAKEYLFIFILIISFSLSFLRRGEINRKNNSNVYFILYCSITGFVTSILGVGGAFMIVPILLYYYEDCVKKAIATSFLVIAITSLLSAIFKVVQHKEYVELIRNDNGIPILLGLAFCGFYIGRIGSKFIPSNIHKVLYQLFIFAIIIFSLS